MAILYNDRSVLENHHVSAAYRLLQDHDMNILVNLNKDDWRSGHTHTQVYTHTHTHRCTVHTHRCTVHTHPHSVKKKWPHTRA